MTVIKGNSRKKTLSLLAVAAANLAPLGMVLLGHWGVGEILLLYWLETGIVGVFTVLRVLLTPAPSPQRKRLTFRQLQTAPSRTTLPLVLADWGIIGKALLALFFFLPYALLLTLQGYILYIFLAVAGPYGWPLQAVLWGALGLSASHALGFAADYLASGESGRAGAETLVGTPFHRLVIMQLVLGCGGWAADSFGHAASIMSVFVAVKLAIDLRPARGYIG
jgi:hypothetical protein